MKRNVSELFLGELLSGHSDIYGNMPLIPNFNIVAESKSMFHKVKKIGEKNLCVFFFYVRAETSNQIAGRCYHLCYHTFFFIKSFLFVYGNIKCDLYFQHIQYINLLINIYLYLSAFNFFQINKIYFFKRSRNMYLIYLRKMSK